MQNYCAEIKIRAERRAGEMLKERERHSPGPAVASFPLRCLYLNATIALRHQGLKFEHHLGSLLCVMRSMGEVRHSAE